MIKKYEYQQEQWDEALKIAARNVTHLIAQKVIDLLPEEVRKST